MTRKIKKSVLLTTLFLSACYSVEKECAGYGCEYDGITPLGIKYRDESTSAPTPDELDVWYKSVNECIGIWIDPSNLFVISTEDIPEYANGLYYQPDQIVIRSSMNNVQKMMVYEHEVVHYLLYKTTGDADSDHLSPFFRICVKSY